MSPTCKHRGARQLNLIECRSPCCDFAMVGFAPVGLCEICPVADLDAIPEGIAPPNELWFHLNSPDRPRVPQETPQESEKRLRIASCLNRGKNPVRVGTCNLCGLRGQPFDIYPCSIHGECSIRYYDRKIHPCIGCEDAQIPPDLPG